MKIYTRTGDSGETGLFGGGRVRKDDPRVEAYGEVDELNATIGVAIVALQEIDAHHQIDRLRLVQEDLFSIGAHLATPLESSGRAPDHLPPLPTRRVSEIEGWIDEADERLSPLHSFILPGGSLSAAHLHLARTVCRRAERRVLALTGRSSIDRYILIYLNRLSDLLFTLARLANLEAGTDDVPWTGRR